MLVSAIMVSILLMSTAATMSDIKNSNYSPIEKDYHVNSIEQVGQKLDLAKKSDRSKFRTAIDYISAYSVDLTYWEENRCYNITLSSPSTGTEMTCAGNGSVFHDGFEDGEHSDPLWIKSGQDGVTEVVTRYPPAEGSKALRLQESGSNSTGLEIQQQDSLNVWNQTWTAEGLYNAGALDASTAQHHVLVLNADENHNQQIRVRLGFTDHSGNQVDFSFMDYGLIDSSGGGINVNWQQDTWYRWEVTHDGSGNYEGRIWEAGETRSSAPVTQASGTTTSETGSIAYTMNGTAGSPFSVAHSYFKIDDQ